MTSKHPSKRLADLYTTGVPTPFVLQYFSRVSDRYQSERELHQLFERERISKKREFFAIPVEAAVRSADALAPQQKFARSTGSRLKRLFWLLVFAAIIIAAYRYGYIKPAYDFIKAVIEKLIASAHS